MALAVFFAALAVSGLTDEGRRPEAGSGSDGSPGAGLGSGGRGTLDRTDARLMSADEALTAGFLHQIVAAAEIEKLVKDIAAKVASHAPITLWATKEAVRRIQAARALPDGDDIVRKVYGSADFKEGVKAFVEKRAPRWTGK